jgi:hypothetical protein
MLNFFRAAVGCEIQKFLKEEEEEKIMMIIVI